MQTQVRKLRAAKMKLMRKASTSPAGNGAGSHKGGGQNQEKINELEREVSSKI